MIIIINGAPGSGKTDVALEVAQLVHADQFVSTRAIADLLNLDTTSPSQTYSLTHFQKTVTNLEQPLLSLLQKSHAKGFSVVVEGIHVTPHVFDQIPIKEKCGFYLAPASLDGQINRLDRKYEMRHIKPLLKERMAGIREIDRYLRQTCKGSGMALVQSDSNETMVQCIMGMIQK